VERICGNGHSTDRDPSDFSRYLPAGAERVILGGLLYLCDGHAARAQCRGGAGGVRKRYLGRSRNLDYFSCDLLRHHSVDILFDDELGAVI